jgi:microcystin-dependent protein
MTCSNCFNGCSEIVSDQCVKYTGIDVPVLGIQTGDSLSYVEQALITFLTSTLDGTGIKIDIPTSTTICTLVKKYLPTCGDLTAVDLFNALIKALCDLQAQVTVIGTSVANIEAAYSTSCLSGVTSTSGTHAILQATIDNLCALNASLTALAIDVDTNYVKNSEICDLVTACIAGSGPGSTKHYLKMVPYTVVEYYGDLTGNFDGNGIGSGDWEKIYLCNGLNGTPDKRGRVGVGAIVGVGGGSLDPEVQPGGTAPYTFNPNYQLKMTAGNNSIALSTNEIPPHTHSATSTAAVHDHILFYQTASTFAGAGSNTAITTLGSGISSVNTAGTTVSVSVTNASTGGGEYHANTQPVLACYYIMYIP